MKIKAILVCHYTFELITLTLKVQLPKPFNSGPRLCVPFGLCLSLTPLIVCQLLTIDPISPLCVGPGWDPTLRACAKLLFVLFAITWFTIEDAQDLLSLSLNIEDAFVACRDSFH